MQKSPQMMIYVHSILENKMPKWSGEPNDLKVALGEENFFRQPASIGHKQAKCWLLNFVHILSMILNYFKLIFTDQIVYLTQCGLVMSYGDIELGQHWLRWWLVAWWHKAITWTSANLQSARSGDNHQRAMACASHQSLTHWGRDKMDAISQTPFSSAFSWMKIFEFRLKFHWSLFLRVQLTIFQHWFR